MLLEAERFRSVKLQSVVHVAGVVAEIESSHISPPSVEGNRSGKPPRAYADVPELPVFIHRMHRGLAAEPVRIVAPLSPLPAPWKRANFDGRTRSSRLKRTLELAILA